MRAYLADLREEERIFDGRATHHRRFTATVFDLNAVEMKRVYSKDAFVNRIKHYVEYERDLAASPDELLRKIVAKAASRALYLLNMDFGQVEVTVEGNGKATVSALSSTMRPSIGEGERLLIAAVEGFVEAKQAESVSGIETTLGADPEFVMLSPAGKIVPASRYFPRGGSMGCDSVVVRGVRRWPLAELRPDPATEPAAVADNLRRLLAAAARRTAGEPLTWRAGAWPVRGLPLGGRVHISGAALTGERLRALDNAVALPLRLLEPPSAASRRPRFGALGDFRRQDHGGFEYRTPPSWLVSPKLARGVLALAKVAAEHASALGSTLRPLDQDVMRDAFYAGDRALLMTGVDAMHERLARTEGYRKYEAFIEPIFRAVARGQTWNEMTDMRERWGIKT